MAIENGLLQELAGNSGVTSILPNDVSGNPQIYWVLAPKGAKPPYVILSRVATSDLYTYQGSTGVRDGLFQVDCYSDSKAGVSSGYYTARSLATAVRDVLSGFRGNLPDTNSTPVLQSLLEKDWDMPYEEGSTGFVFRVLLEFRVYYVEGALSIGPNPNFDLTIDGDS
jgi:hypothetical protein